jgi:hypothetical protein
VKPCARYCSFENRWLSLERYMYFFNAVERPFWRQQSLCPPWNTYVSERFHFQKLTQFSQETMCYMLLWLKQMVFFQEMHVFLQLTWIALFESKWAFLHLENSDFQEIFLWNTISILTGNDVLHAPATQTNGFLSRDACISSNHLNSPIWIKMSFSPPWKLWFSGTIPFKTHSILTERVW